jgi:hypothetical protein
MPPTPHPRDLKYVPSIQREYGELFPTHGSGCTLRREKLLVQHMLDHIRCEPVYGLMARLPTLVR